MIKRNKQIFLFSLWVFEEVFPVPDRHTVMMTQDTHKTINVVSFLGYGNTIHLAFYNQKTSLSSSIITTAWRTELQNFGYTYSKSGVFIVSHLLNTISTPMKKSLQIFIGQHHFISRQRMYSEVNVTKLGFWQYCIVVLLTLIQHELENQWLHLKYSHNCYVSNITYGLQDNRNNENALVVVFRLNSYNISWRDDNSSAPLSFHNYR